MKERNNKMNRWEHKLNVSNFYHDATLSIREKAKRMSVAIAKLPLDKIEMYCGYDFQDAIDDFSNVGTWQEFDEAMDLLYGLCDRHGIWVITRN